MRIEKGFLPQSGAITSTSGKGGVHLTLLKVLSRVRYSPPHSTEGKGMGSPRPPSPQYKVYTSTLCAMVRWRTLPSRPFPYRTRAWFFGLHSCGHRLLVPRMPRSQLHEPSPALMFTNLCATDPSLLRSTRCFSGGLGGSSSRSSTDVKRCASISALVPPTPSSPPVSRPCFH